MLPVSMGYAKEWLLENWTVVLAIPIIILGTYVLLHPDHNLTMFKPDFDRMS